jgi:hypothetical protein
LYARRDLRRGISNYEKIGRLLSSTGPTFLDNRDDLVDDLFNGNPALFRFLTQSYAMSEDCPSNCANVGRVD